MDNDFSRAMKNFDKVWARVQQNKTPEARTTPSPSQPGSSGKKSGPASSLNPGGKSCPGRPCSGGRGSGRRRS